MDMQLDSFVAERQPEWQELETLLQKSDRRAAQLSQQEIQKLGRLYRQATSDLAIAQRDFHGQRATAYLNQLVGRAHALIYREDPPRWRQVRDFYACTFPQLYRKLLPYTILAFILFTLPALAAFFTVCQQPDAIFVMLGPSIRRLVETVEAGDLWTEIAPSVRSAASAAILTNNIQVMFLTFAGGMTAGLLTLWVMVSNGLNLGAIFGLLQVHGLSAGLAEFIVAHGFIELSVIFLAGGCGLYLADGILRPGLLARRDALLQRGRESVSLILGCVPLLILAGFIEGFASPSSLPWWVKLAIGTGTGIALHWYWLATARSVPSIRSVPLP
jgi:uncharacterized membrane protein SpoIIM required for sporulation